MNHFSYEQWTKYVKNELKVDIREELDNHLYTCDQCLELYLHAVDEIENELPELSNEQDFTNAIMANISEQKVNETVIKQPNRNKPFYQNALFHYTLAAAMTILLMTTGVFQSITKYTETVQKAEFQEKKPSVTEGIMDKTFAWMDSLETVDKEGNK